MVGQNLLGHHAEVRAEHDLEVNVRAEREIEVILRHLEYQNTILIVSCRNSVLKSTLGRGTKSSNTV
jgi:uncharacterized membrane protein